MKHLKDDIRNGNVILFVGAGVSATLMLPTWSELIDKIALDLNFDADVFKTYGDFYALAEYYKIKKSNLKLLVKWMDDHWNNNHSIDISKSLVHELIAKSNFNSIYTTNYDNWIEKAHDFYNVDYNKIISVSDIAKIGTFKKEIVKFHGDLSVEKSIVFTETSYYDRLQFETPLDIKLRSDVLGKSVLFIGYSLSDINVRHLFYRLSSLWVNHGEPINKPKSYLFAPTPNPIQAMVIKRWGIETIGSNIDNPGKALEMFLKNITLY